MPQAPLGSVLLNPISFAQSWHYITIAGTRSPGAIPVDGINGFDREIGWDVKEGKGTQGATLTLKSAPLAEGSISFQLWLPDHFAEWTSFRDLLSYNPKNVQKAALDIYHPSLADLKINAVVTRGISPIRHVGLGKYIVSVEFIEWIAPPKKSIVKTPAGAAVDDKNKAPGSLPDPIGDAQQAEIARLAKVAGLAGAP